MVFTVGSHRMIKTSMVSSLVFIMSMYTQCYGQAGDVVTKVDQNGRYTGGKRGSTGQGSGVRSACTGAGLGWSDGANPGHYSTPTVATD